MTFNYKHVRLALPALPLIGRHLPEYSPYGGHCYDLRLPHATRLSLPPSHDDDVRTVPVCMDTLPASIRVKMISKWALSLHILQFYRRS